MEITKRETHAFIELKVIETETTIFKSDKFEIEKTIENLQEVIDALKTYLPTE